MTTQSATESDLKSDVQKNVNVMKVPQSPGYCSDQSFVRATVDPRLATVEAECHNMRVHGPVGE